MNGMISPPPTADREPRTTKNNYINKEVKCSLSDMYIHVHVYVQHDDTNMI